MPKRSRRASRYRKLADGFGSMKSAMAEPLKEAAVFYENLAADTPSENEKRDDAKLSKMSE